MKLQNSDIFYNELGAQIKIERMARSITQDALAEELNLTRASIMNIEKGRHKPSIYQIIMIANYFKIEYTNLIPVLLEQVDGKEKKTATDLSNMVSDQIEIDSPSKQAILDFLSSVRK